MTKSDELDDTMRVLATGTCETLSGSSKLTYHIGRMPDGEIYLRVHGNTGGGFFSQEWIALTGHPDGTQKASRRKAHHVHPAESPLTGQVGQHSGVHDGCPAARESGSFDAGKAPET